MANLFTEFLICPKFFFHIYVQFFFSIIKTFYDRKIKQSMKFQNGNQIQDERQKDFYRLKLVTLTIFLNVF
jgi:hypothetical protein